MESLICRVCLQIVNDPIDMSYAVYKDKIRITEIFKKCTDIQLNPDDTKILCDDCQKRLIDAYEFRCQAQDAFEILSKPSITQVMIKQEHKEQIECEVDVPFDGPESLKSEENDKKMFDLSKPFIKNVRPRPNTEEISKIEMPKFQCRYCLKFILEGLREHEKQHVVDNGGFQCHHCHKMLINRDRLRSHLNVVHFGERKNRPRNFCTECDRSYVDPSALKKHMSIWHSGNPIPKEICPHCGKETLNVKSHIENVHYGKITCYCDECGKGFKTKSSLAVHIKYHHRKIREFECPICHKFYRSRFEAKVHLQSVHNDERKFHCETCDKKFKCEASYINHRKLHLADYDHSCEECGARFKASSYLREHMKTHSERKDFVCQICAVAFRRKPQLTRHMRHHNGIRFSCPLCPGADFIDKSHLKEHHERVHIGIRYRCDVCGKDYGCKKHLVQHQKASKCDRSKWTRIVPETPINL